jgi:hypothetical protein
LIVWCLLLLLNPPFALSVGAVVGLVFAAREYGASGA